MDRKQHLSKIRRMFHHDYELPCPPHFVLGGLTGIHRGQRTKNSGLHPRQLVKANVCRANRLLSEVVGSGLFPSFLFELGDSSVLPQMLRPRIHEHLHAKILGVMHRMHRSQVLAQVTRPHVFENTSCYHPTPSNVERRRQALRLDAPGFPNHFQRPQK